MVSYVRSVFVQIYKKMSTKLMKETEEGRNLCNFEGEKIRNEIS